MDRRDFLLHILQPALISAMGFHVSCTRPKETTVDSTTTDSTTTDSKFVGLGKRMASLLKETKTPGMSLAVVQDGNIAWTGAFGVRSRDTDEPVDTDTIFEAASVSKTVFAYMVMKLCEKKVISLDTPLSEYYPELFSNGDPRLRIITPRQVLSHTTGLPNWRDTAGLTFQFDPGKDFLYSGEGYYLLQTVVTHLTGKTFTDPCGQYENNLKVCATDIADYLQQNILAPFHMKNSSYLWSDELGGNAAMAHDINEKVIKKTRQNRADMARYASAGGLLTTAKDYAKFLTGLFEAKSDDPFRLNATSISEMIRPQAVLRPDQQIDGCNAWALGWGIQERPAGNLIVHSGGQSGFRSLVIASPEKKSGFVALTNGDNGGHVIYTLQEALDDLW